MADIEQEQFNRFLAAKAPEKPCPECGTNHWLVQGRTAPEGGTVIARLILSTGGGEGAYMASMFCSNCGYIKSFRYPS
jgi:hypothetical protein